MREGEQVCPKAEEIEVSKKELVKHRVTKVTRNIILKHEPKQRVSHE